MTADKPLSKQVKKRNKAIKFAPLVTGRSQVDSEEEMDIAFLRPREKLRVMDLVESTGIDVSDWANFKGGAEKAASNPKYCYAWSYEDQNKKLIALNLWYEDIEILDDKITQRLNMREVAKNAARSSKSHRAAKMDCSLRKAAERNCPVRVIICDGERNATTSSVVGRLLDVEQWHVKSYRPETGECILVRDLPTELLIDQFSIEKPPVGRANKRETTAKVYDRNPQVRNYVLKRANGQCEWCGDKGFNTSSGAIYLETHHIQPLSENGSDTVYNVIALCPNHHRESHFGEHAAQLRKKLAKQVKKLNTPIQSTANAPAP